jgi:adenylosuccinate lyase
MGTETQTPTAPQNPLHERYASRQMAELFTAEHRFGTWRRLWIALAESQQKLGLPITDEQIAALHRAAPLLDVSRVAEIERETRHDVVAHLRHFAEQADGDAGGILHLGATSAFITDNTDVLLTRDALKLLEQRLVSTIRQLMVFARQTRSIPALAYTHFQPAQLTTVGKRACLWCQDFLEDLDELRHRIRRLRCRGVKGTTGTQASYLTLFDGDHDKVRQLDQKVAERLGFAESWPLTGQTYTRKMDSQVLATLAGVGESAHKMGTDLRLLQGVGELGEPFDDNQVGSSAMAYKKNPIRAERMCGLARRLITDSLNGPLNHATQWLERSLDDSANRRLVLPDAFLAADAVLALAAHIIHGLRVDEGVVAARVAQELPFMATETLLMKAVLKGGDRQELHESIRRYSLEARRSIATGSASGRDNPMIDLIAEDPDFRLSREEIEQAIDPTAFTGRSSRQVDEFLAERVEPAISESDGARLEDPRV